MTAYEEAAMWAVKAATISNPAQPKVQDIRAAGDLGREPLL
jgi:hypothetical protein